MKFATVAILATVAGGLLTAGSVAAAPISAGRSSIAADVQPLVSNVGWENVCRDRNIVRRNRNGSVLRFTVPICNMVWIGQRYYFAGRYYADPNFVAQIY